MIMKELLNFKVAKKKFQALILGLVLLLIVAYRFSFSKTIAAYQTFKLQSKSLGKAQNAPLTIQNYQQLIQQLEGRLNANLSYDREQLFELVNTFCAANDLSLAGFHPERRQQSNDYEIITTPIEIKGGYIDMVKLAYQLEFVDRIGHIASLEFVMEKDRINKKDNLIGRVYLQNINSDESD